MSTTVSEMFGMRVVVSPHLPVIKYPDHRDDARRIVRHGMAEILEWLGEEVGPLPGEPVTTHAYIVSGSVIASAYYAALIGMKASR